MWRRLRPHARREAFSAASTTAGRRWWPSWWVCSSPWVRLSPSPSPRPSSACPCGSSYGGRVGRGSRRPLQRRSGEDSWPGGRRTRLGGRPPGRLRRRAHHFPAEEGSGMATTNDLKNGMVLNLDGQLWQVIWFQHHKPGKGGAVVRSKLKNVESGKVVDRTFNADVKVDVANVDKRTMQYLYNDGTSYVFMDTGTYDQVEIDPQIVGGAKNFMLENQEAIVASNDGRVLYIELPASVELEITYTEPGVVGDSATGRTKPATLETGHQIQVPLFITQGEKVKVETRDSSYLGRVKA